MARIVRTTPTAPRKSFLLKAGLSIFLFLQIQVPSFHNQALAKAESLPLSIEAKLTQKTYSVVTKTGACTMVALAEKAK